MALRFNLCGYVIILLLMLSFPRHGECCQPSFGRDALYSDINSESANQHLNMAPFENTDFATRDFFTDEDIIGITPYYPFNPATENLNKNILENAKFRSFKISQQSECPMELFTLADFYACTVMRPFNDDANAASGGRMKCNFDVPSICRFYSSPEESIQWKRGHFQASGTRFSETFALMMDRSVDFLPSGDFIFIGESTPRSGYGYAILRADIGCQLGNGKLSFDFWKNDPNIQAKVCTRVEVSRSCTQALRYNDSLPVDIDVINPNILPFAIEIIISDVTEPSLFILDNLSYEASLCTTTDITQLSLQNMGNINNSLDIGIDPSQIFFDNSENADSFEAQLAQQKGQLQRGGETNHIRASNMRRLLPIHRLTPCEVLNCDFEFDLCSYYNPFETNSTNRFGQWNVARERNGNIHTGIRQKTSAHMSRRYQSGYAFVGADDLQQPIKGRRIYVLESPMFTLDDDSMLTFDLYRRSTAISLQVCLNNITNCPYEAPPLESNIFWRRGETIALSKDTRKVYFIATQWKKFKWLAIDNITLNYDTNCRNISIKKRN
uniref:MAM domain-containing protein n=3 Tax=Parascaris univalens TaxID=6257 RepID=A0A915BT26_PARUN